MINSVQSFTDATLAPRVSIGMPVYNGGETLALALDSLRGQTFSSFELIITDNVSSDKTPEICLKYAAADMRITYIRNTEPVHPMENFNRSLNLARAPYFMWAAHDDIREPEFIAELVKALDDNTNAVLAFCGFNNIDAEGKCVRQYHEDWERIFSSSKFYQFIAMTMWDDARTQKANAPIYGLFRRSALIGVGGMKPVHNAVFCGEDVLLLLRLLAVGEFHYVNKVLFHYRVRKHATRAPGESVLKYVASRVWEKKEHHRGSLMLFLSRNHANHREMRNVIINVSPLSFLAKMLIYVMLFAREVWVPVKTIPRAVIHELRAN